MADPNSSPEPRPLRIRPLAERKNLVRKEDFAKVLPPVDGFLRWFEALPDIYGSLRALFGMAFGYIMLAELINAEHGLGYLLSTSQRRGLSEHIILILFIIGLIAFLIDRFLLWMQHGLFPYQSEPK